MNFEQSVEQIQPQLTAWRRDFHKHPESGFLELRTASIVATTLENLGYEVSVGDEVMSKDDRMGLPSDGLFESHKAWALDHGAEPRWVEKMAGGMTGVVGVLQMETPGPVVAFRVDMDALDIQEDLSEEHLPYKEGFASINNMMHACGHDGHTSIGLGLATILMQEKAKLKGTIKLIFQPAEEGVRGAKSMTEAGVVDDVDYFVATHIGLGLPLGEVIAGDGGFLASTKLNVEFKGLASHAGGNPNEGKNAIMAASTAVLGLYGIPRHSEGASRINVGVLNAGSGRNIIPSSANMKIETRGVTSTINDYIREQALQVIHGAGAMYGVTATVELAGEAISCMPSEEMAEIVSKAAQKSDSITNVIKMSLSPSGSEDATYFMNRVQERGGIATYTIFGSPLAAGHHNERFDYDEKVLPIAVEVLARTAFEILSN
ncbi:amidohydrolase [Sporosarcina sp. CAU 1771]